MLWKKAGCYFGKHVRDGRRTHFDGELFVSRCKNCGVPLAKDFDRGWIPLDSDRKPQSDPIATTLLETPAQEQDRASRGD